jgi:hypothetical protein
MNQKEYKWHVNLVKSRYERFGLTYKQAEQVFKYKQDKEVYSEKHHFTEWEDIDYEWTVFQQILDEKQMLVYQKEYEENLRRIEADLKAQDKEAEKEIAFYLQQADYYENEFVPDFFKNPIAGGLQRWLDKAKIDFLKVEYKRMLIEIKKEILTSHFRHYRTFKPNGLRVSLLQHRIAYLWPDYDAFKRKMDEPTKAVAKYVESKAEAYLLPEIEAFFAQKFEDLAKFNKKSFEEYHAKTVGWTIGVATGHSISDKNHEMMCLLLLDKDKYGYQE